MTEQIHLNRWHLNIHEELNSSSSNSDVNLHRDLSQQHCQNDENDEHTWNKDILFLDLLNFYSAKRKEFFLKCRNSLIEIKENPLNR